MYLFAAKHIVSLGALNIAHEQRVDGSGARDDAVKRRVEGHLPDPLVVHAHELYQLHCRQQPGLRVTTYAQVHLLTT